MIANGPRMPSRYIILVSLMRFHISDYSWGLIPLFTFVLRILESNINKKQANCRDLDIERDSSQTVPTFNLWRVSSLYVVLVNPLVNKQGLTSVWHEVMILALTNMLNKMSLEVRLFLVFTFDLNRNSPCRIYSAVLPLLRPSRSRAKGELICTWI